MGQVAPEQSAAQQVRSFHKPIRPTFKAWRSCKSTSMAHVHKTYSSNRLLLALNDTAVPTLVRETSSMAFHASIPRHFHRACLAPRRSFFEDCGTLKTPAVSKMKGV